MKGKIFVLSIVIITCNRKEELIKTVSSCIECSTELFELIIVDNGSNDGTQKAVEEIVIAKEVNLKYIYSKENLGVAGGRNKGFDEAQGEIVYFIDDDAYITSEKGAFRKVRTFFDENPSIAIVATQIFNVTSGQFQYSAFPKGASQQSNGVILNFVGASHFIRKSAFNDKYLYPGSLFYGGEEYYASLRTWGMDLKVWYYHDFKVHHIPSKKTRLSIDDMKLRSIVNAYVVKRLLYPKAFSPLVYLNFILRLFKHYNRKLGLINMGLRTARERLSSEKQNPLRIDKVLHLCKLFGIKRIL